MANVPFSLIGIDHVVLRVTDMTTMIEFYCDILGGTVERQIEEFGLVQLRAGSSLVDLVDVDGKIGRNGGAAPGAEGRNLDHFCLRIDRFDATTLKKYLTGRGVCMGEMGSRYGADGAGPSLYIYDPEGNTVELKGSPN